MKTKILKVEDIPTLFDLTFKNHYTEHPTAVAQELLFLLQRKSVSAFKLVDDSDTIYGYIIGYGLTKDVFYFADIFVLTEKRKYVKQFVTEVEEIIAKSYKTWLSNAATLAGKKLLNKLGERI